MKTSEFIQTRLYERWFWGNNPTPAYSFLFQRSYRRAVSAISIVKGNFKSPNPWSYSVSTQSYLQGSYSRVSSGKPWEQIRGQLSNTDTFVPAFDYTTLASQVRNNALEKLNGKVRGSLDLATSLAESGQTWKMLNLTRRLTDTMIDMKRSWKREILNQLKTFKKRRQADAALRRWQRGIKARNPGSYRPLRPKDSGGLVNGSTKALANGWCEYTYGLSPLLSDIHGIATNIVGFTRNCVVKASASQAINLRNSSTVIYGDWTGPAKREYTGFVKSSFGVRLRPNFDTSFARWTSLNPLSVAWELMPYSFVVDWVFDVGSYMRNLETSMLMATYFLDGYESLLVKYEGVASCSSRVSGGLNSYADLVASGSFGQTVFNRSILLSYPAPSLPSFKLDLGSNRLLSAAALLRQLIR